MKELPNLNLHLLINLDFGTIGVVKGCNPSFKISLESPLHTSSIQGGIDLFPMKPLDPRNNTSS